MSETTKAVCRNLLEIARWLDSGGWLVSSQSCSMGAAEIERLEAIVGKLPKCWRLNGSSKLVRDAPVTLGMAVYFTRTFHRPWPRAGEVARGTANQVWLRDEDGLPFADVQHAGGSTMILVEELYSTREAARAAVKQNEPEDTEGKS